MNARSGIGNWTRTASRRSKSLSAAAAPSSSRPIPKPRKAQNIRAPEQEQIIFDEGKGLSTKEQQYDPTSIINQLRQQVDQWRSLPNPNSGR
jgi:hypothetical protein